MLTKSETRRSPGLDQLPQASRLRIYAPSWIRTSGLLLRRPFLSSLIFGLESGFGLRKRNFERTQEDTGGLLRTFLFLPLFLPIEAARRHQARARSDRCRKSSHPEMVEDQSRYEPREASFRSTSARRFAMCQRRNPAAPSSLSSGPKRQPRVHRFAKRSFVFPRSTPCLSGFNAAARLGSNQRPLACEVFDRGSGIWL